MTRQTPTTTSKLTPIARKIILAAIRNGLPRKLAAQMAGVDRITLYHWITKGERGETKYKRFAQDVARAEAEWAAEGLKTFKAAKDWRGYAWLFARRFPQEFGRAAKMLGPSDEPIDPEEKFL